MIQPPPRQRIPYLERAVLPKKDMSHESRAAVQIRAEGHPATEENEKGIEHERDEIVADPVEARRVVGREDRVALEAEPVGRAQGA